MKVKIKKEGKKETFNLIDSWSDVTLEKWAELVSLNEGTKSKEALETIRAMSDIPKQLINQLSLYDVAGIMGAISKMQEEANNELQNIIEIDGVEYGFHPNLSDITLGEYADLETFIKEGVDKSLPEIMAVLYRPITERKGKYYTIEAYDGDIRLRAEEMKKMSAEQVQSALVFFWSFAKQLLIILPLYLMEQTEAIVKQQQTKPLQVNGVGSEFFTD